MIEKEKRSKRKREFEKREEKEKANWARERMRIGGFGN
jgi:hypothetical protein